MSSDAKARSKVLDTIRSLVLKRHFNAGGIDYREWTEQLEGLRPELVGARPAEFERGVQRVLGLLRSSHTAFYHDQPSSFRRNTL